MNVQELVKSYKNTQTYDVSEFLSKIVFATTIDEKLELLSTIAKMFSQNIQRDEFFNKQGCQIILGLIMQTWSNEQIMKQGCSFLRLILAECSNQCQALINEIVKKLHIPKYSDKFYIYQIMCQIFDGPGSVLFLNMSGGIILTKLYRQLIKNQNYMTQMDQVFTLEKYDDSENDSDEESNSQMSSLSLDEDGGVKLELSLDMDDEKQPKQRSARSILSKFAQTVFDEDSRSHFDQMTSSREQKQIQSDSSRLLPQIQSGSSEVKIQIQSLSKLPEKIKIHNKFDLGDDEEYAPYSKLISEGQSNQDSMYKKESIALSQKCNDILNQLQDESSDLNSFDIGTTQQVINERYATKGPMTLYYIENSPRPLFVPRLKLEKLKTKSFNNPKIESIPLNLKNIKDREFQSQIEQIQKAKQGQQQLFEIGKLIGQYVAMSDYPTIAQWQSKSGKFEPQIINKKIRNQQWVEQMISNINSRELTLDINFQLDEVIHDNQMNNLPVEDQKRIGILYLIKVLIQNQEQMSVQEFQGLQQLLVFDIMYMRQKKSGFCQMSLYICTIIYARLLQIDIPYKTDAWQNTILKMYNYIDTPLKFYDEVTKKFVTQEKDNMKVIERRTVILPRQFELLERLEGLRRTVIPGFQMLCDKLFACTKHYKDLSALEDIPIISGTLFDILNSTKEGNFMKQAAVEQIFPIYLKLIDLITQKKIKSRQYYIFISHRILQVTNNLIQQTKFSVDQMQFNFNENFMKIFEKNDMSQWFKRYGYLILMNSRVIVEVSGLFINQKQCVESFNQIRRTYFEFVKNICQVMNHQYFTKNYNSEIDENILELSSSVKTGKMSNLIENDKPYGIDDNFDLKYNLTQLPLHMMIHYQISKDTLYQLQNKSIFQRQRNIIIDKNVYKTSLNTQLYQEFEYLIDYDVGVLMQFLFLNQESIVQSDNDRQNYISCLIALEQIVKIPNMLNKLPEEQLNKYVIFHYISFLKFYNSSISTITKFKQVSDFTIAKHHILVISAFCQAVDSYVRVHINMIRIVDFLVQQISFESTLNNSQQENIEAIYSESKVYGSNNDKNFKVLELQANNDSDLSEESGDFMNLIKTPKIQNSSNTSKKSNSSQKKKLENLFIDSLVSEQLGDNLLSPTMFNMNFDGITDIALVNSPRQLTKTSNNVSIKEKNDSFSDSSDSDSSFSFAPVPQQQPPPSLLLSLNDKPKNTSKQETKAEAKQQIDVNIKMHLLLGQNQSSQTFEKKGKQSKSELPAIPIYFDCDLHEAVITCLFHLIVKPDTGTFDQNYITQFPTNLGMQNILFILHHHLNFAANQQVVEKLLIRRLSNNHERLLRLLCYQKFNPEFYSLDKYNLIAKGAFGQVFSGTVNMVSSESLQKCGTPVAIKLQSLCQDINGRCVLFDLYNEISIMERLQKYQNFCQIYDYGVSKYGYVQVMQKYTCSFRQLRFKLFDEKIVIKPNCLNENRRLQYYGHEFSMMKYVRLILLSYIKLLEELQLMHDEQIIHFDLKADNIFINPASIQWLAQNAQPNINDKEFVSQLFESFSQIQSVSLLPFRITIGDFGESYAYSNKNDMFTKLSKGTEFNKSPEMLSSTNQQQKFRFSQKFKGAGPPSDIWSAACTLYEMLTGDYLFYDSDWIRFFLKITTEGKNEEKALDSFGFCQATGLTDLVRGIHLIPEKRAMLGNCQPLIDLLEFQLVQDQTKRPNINQCILLTKHILKYYFPASYKFNQTNKFTEALPGCTFPANGFNFEIIADIEQLSIIDDIIAPKLMITNTDKRITGQKIPQIIHIQIQQPSDILQNGFILLGSSKDAENAAFLNQRNIQTIIDCNTDYTSSDPHSVHRIIRPSSQIINLFKEQTTITKESVKHLILSLETIFDSIRCTFAQSGCVLFIDEDGTRLAANLCLACLMEFENLYLYQAAVHLKRQRPTIRFNERLMELLLMWHDKRIKIGIKLISLFPNQKLNPKINMNDPEIYDFATIRVAQANYRCACGRVFFVIKPKAVLQYVVCNCVISDEYGKTYSKKQAIDCPSTSCRTILNYFQSLFGLKLPKCLWVYVGDEDCYSNWGRATQQVALINGYQQSYNQQLHFRSVDETRAPLYRIPIKDEWRLQYCVLCGCPTHYVRMIKNKAEICILANFSNK